MSFTERKFLGPGMAISTAKKPFNWFPGPNGLAGWVRAGQSQAQWRQMTTLEKTALITGITGIAGQDGSYRDPRCQKSVLDPAEHTEQIGANAHRHRRRAALN